MKYTFKELIDVPKLQELTDELYAVASIPSAIVAMDGEILTGSGWQRICTDFHRKNPQIEKECIKSDTNISRKLKNGESFAIYKCPRGLVDASSPIIIDGEHVANVFSGQIFFEQPDETTVQFFREQACKFGLDEAEYIKALREVPVFTEKKFRAGISFLAKLSQSIAEMGLTRLRELESIKTLQESEERLSTVLETSPIPTAVGGLDGSIISFNKALEQLIGYNQEEIIDINDWSCKLYPDEEYREFVQANINKALEGKKQEQDEFTITCKDGSTKIISFKTSFYQDGLIIQMVDITDRVRAEDALRKSEENYRLIIENQTDMIVKFNAEGQLLFISPSYCKAFDKTQEELLGKKFMPLIHGDDRESVKKNIRKVYQPPYTGYVEERAKTKDGWRWQAWLNTAVLNEESEIDSIIAVGRDITERKQAEEALRESENELRLITENTRDLISISALDMKATFLYASPSYEKLLGYSPDELIGTSGMDFIHPEDKKKLLPLVKKYVFGKAKQLISGKKEAVFETLEYRLPQKSGGWRHMEATATVIGGKVIIINRDVTDRIEAEEERERLEAKLQRAKKMESMGLMAGGVAHDLNNVLSGIVSYPELLLLDLPEDSKLRKPIETIQNSGNRAVDIVQDLLTVARGVATAKEPLNLNTLVGDYLDSPEFNNLEQFHPSVKVKPNLDKDIFNIIGSPVHIIKVVMNLVSNASEAIDGSGNVTISTMNRYVDRPLRGYDDINIGEYAILTVSDDGSGISSDDLERIFEPFYTKKVMGMSGTGLGLAVVWNVIQDHKGYIDVRSDGNGTTFEMYFPITRDEMSDGGLSIPIEDYKGNGETILIVDDVENQRDISCKMLETLGYNTKAVSSGEEAVEYLKENTADLILLDMIMDPGINGHETYERIVKIHPEQKAVIVSGFSESDEVKAAQELGAGRYIKKPFTLEKIGLAVKEELEKE